MEINILGHKYTLTFNDKLHHERNSYGTYCGSSMEIAIDPSYSESRKTSTIIHELIEAINHELEVGLEHKQITLLESGLFQILTSNPKLIEELGIKG